MSEFISYIGTAISGVIGYMTQILQMFATVPVLGVAFALIVMGVIVSLAIRLLKRD